MVNTVRQYTAAGITFIAMLLIMLASTISGVRNSKEIANFIADKMLED